MRGPFFYGKTVYAVLKNVIRHRSTVYKIFSFFFSIEISYFIFFGWEEENTKFLARLRGCRTLFHGGMHKLVPLCSL